MKTVGFLTLALVLCAPCGLFAGPVTETAQTEQAKLLASDGAALDEFGWPVSVSGDTAVIGSPADADNGFESGSAYVFVHSGEVWTEQAKLLPSDGAVADWFGFAVSIAGDTAVIGSLWDDDSGLDSGSAYVFVRSGGVWSEQAKLLPSDGATLDRFGYAVSVAGDTAVIGAYRDDDSGLDSGSAYVFVRSGEVWSEQAKLLASDGGADDQFGHAVSIAGDTAVIDARLDDDNGNGSGSAYVFVRSGEVWSEQTKLLASDGAAGDWFGRAVSVAGDTAVIGAREDDDNGNSSGSAYVFVRSGEVWSEQAKLLPSDGAGRDRFGSAVSIVGHITIIGARGDQDFVGHSGAAYVFVRSGEVWSEQAKLLPSDGAADDLFGCTVSVAGGIAVIGSPYHDDNGVDSGAVYVYSLSSIFADGFESGDTSAWSNTVQ